MIVLADGTVLGLVGVDDCCAYYALETLAPSTNVITAVRFEYTEQDEGPGSYAIFVFCDNEQINLSTFDGTDGTGYYGTGFTIFVKPPAKD